MSVIPLVISLEKAGGPYIGPRGGKWADPKHTIPWSERKVAKPATLQPTSIPSDRITQAIADLTKEPRSKLDEFKSRIEKQISRLESENAPIPVTLMRWRRIVDAARSNQDLAAHAHTEEASGFKLIPTYERGIPKPGEEAPERPKRKKRLKKQPQFRPKQAQVLDRIHEILYPKRKGSMVTATYKGSGVWGGPKPSEADVLIAKDHAMEQGLSPVAVEAIRRGVIPKEGSLLVDVDPRDPEAKEPRPGRIQEQHFAEIHGTGEDSEIRLFGTAERWVRPESGEAPKPTAVDYDITYRVGDSAEYGSYNLHYIGKITSIGNKTVTIIEPYGENSRKHRLKLRDFSWRNRYGLERAYENNRNWTD